MWFHPEAAGAPPDEVPWPKPAPPPMPTPPSPVPP